MKPFKIVVSELSPEPVTLRCTHAKLWPPPLMTLDLDIEQMWTGGEISQHDYQQIETWKRICGLLEMGEKCVGCPLAKLEQPRIGHEHHGRKDMVGLHDAIRKAIAERNRASKLAAGATPAPATEPAPVPGASEPETASEPVVPETFAPDPEEFRDETVNVEEPDYPIPGNGNGGSVQTFEPDPEPEAPADDLDDLLDGLGDD